MAKSNHSTPARPLHKLPASILKTAEPGKYYGDGGGLWLIGAKQWEFRYSTRGRIRHKGLGSACPASARFVTLAQARARAVECRALLAKGIDPIDTKKAVRKTFLSCAAELIASKAIGWRNDKHVRQWGTTIHSYCGPLLDLPVDEIDTEAVLGVLQPIWLKIPETASRLRGRIEAVLDYAKAHGWRSGENPAAWRGHLALILPKRQKLTRGHYAAMPYPDVPAFIARLREREATAALALRFLTLTAARSGEVLGARWAEFDLEAKVWTVPASRMKAGREHRVPLSGRALAILEGLSEARTGEFVFPGQNRRRHLSSMALEALLRRMKIEGATVHGFRSSFRDWAGDQTSFPRELAEAALAHVSGDATERAYRRGDALEKRRALMEAWASFCEPGGQEANVLPMRRA